MPQRYRAAQFALKIIYLIECRFGEGYSRAGAGREPMIARSRERVLFRSLTKGAHGGRTDSERSVSDRIIPRGIQRDRS